LYLANIADKNNTIAIFENSVGCIQKGIHGIKSHHFAQNNLVQKISTAIKANTQIHIKI
jgi:hypothetical protein